MFAGRQVRRGKMRGGLLSLGRVVAPLNVKWGKGRAREREKRVGHEHKLLEALCLTF